MRTWAAALLNETWPAALGAFSLASTILAFLPAVGIYHFRWVPLICLIGAFAWANFRVFSKQQMTIKGLQLRVAALEAIRAQLVIHPRGPSTYILVRPQADRIYVQLDLVLENRGGRASNVNQFELYIRGTDKTFSQLQPSYPNQVVGKSIYALSGTGLAMGGHITVDAEKMTDRGKLAFFVPFVPSGSHSPDIECTLTIADTEGVSASHEFQLKEL